jgi:hypothetical protein
MLDIERVTASDAEWFSARPFAEFYYRTASWAEGVELLLHDKKLQNAPPELRFTVAGRVRVEQFEPGVRGRRFDDVFFIVE